MENITAESTGFSPPSVGADTLFEDRYDAARRLANDLPSKFARDTVVVAVSHGGAEVAAEVARTLRLPLDIVVVRKIRHPQAPERVLGAVAPGYAVYVRSDTGLTDRQVAIATADARREVDVLDARLHAGREPIAVAGRQVLLVDDGITTGARMIAATRWARTQRARKVAAAVPLAAAEGAADVRDEVDIFYCPNELELLGAVGIWYEEFDPVEDEDVLRLLDAAELEASAHSKPHTPRRHHHAGLGHRRAGDR